MSYANPPDFTPNTVGWLRDLSRAVKGILQGKTNNVGTLTLSANTTTTTITVADGRLGKDTHISITAKTASAKTAASAGISISISVANNQFTLTHNNTADTDKTFSYALIG